ncbi:hypothetical protein [Lutibacter sp.]|uniref:hypothetical protein n=1 Tax=Lutibacter sp. TaxID=1925666 RepID=UPI00356AA1B9
MRIFKEEQKFNQLFVIVGLLMAFIITSITTYQNWQTVSEESFSKKLGSLIGIIIVLIVALLFVFLKLKTRVDEIGIHYKFYPFQFNFKTIPWKNIAKCYIRKYEAISEYGGWGIKYSFFTKRGKCYTTKGNIGLQLELKNGKKILFGTQLKDTLQKTLDTYQKNII